MEPDFDALVAQVKRLSDKLDQRIVRHNEVAPYQKGAAPLPPAIKASRLTKVYRYLMPIAEAPWGSLITDSKLDRLEVNSLRDKDQSVADRIWDEVWQPNEMDAETKLAHGAALLDGRCFATVWPGEDADAPDIALDDCTQMIVEFADGSRRRRVAALRRWGEGDTVYATLYRPDGIYKFEGAASSGVEQASAGEWKKREVDGEDWPIANPFEKVNVVEIAVNRELVPGRFPFARGEFEHCRGLLDRINLLTFLGLVIAFWMGFPMRGVIGDKIRREMLVTDDGEPIIDPSTGKQMSKALPPIDVEPGGFFQFENPEAKLAEFKEANRRNLSIYDELQQLAVITKTPRHYFPMEGGIANIGTETVNAFEGAMHAAVTGHKASMGGGWEEVCRLGGMVLDDPAMLSQNAELGWTDHEFRSLAEKADAATKLKEVLPQAAILDYVLGASQDEISRWMSMSATNPLLNLVAAAKEPAPPSVPVPAG